MSLSLSGEDVRLGDMVRGVFLLGGKPVFIERSLALDLMRESGPTTEV
jgi:hypothetical protein